MSCARTRYHRYLLHGRTEGADWARDPVHRRVVRRRETRIVLAEVGRPEIRQWQDSPSRRWCLCYPFSGTPQRPGPSGGGEGLSSCGIGYRDSNEARRVDSLSRNTVTRSYRDAGYQECWSGIELIPGVVGGASTLTVRIGARLFHCVGAKAVNSDPEGRV